MNYKSKETLILHADRKRNPQYGSLHEPIHTSVAFGYESSRDLAEVFQGKKKGHAYSRQKSPTNDALENKINILEDGIATTTFATGMSAITHAIIALTKKGDHVIASQYLFGNTNSVFDTLVRHGLEFDFVDATSAKNVEEKIRPNTKIVFTETIANPVTQIADLSGIGDICEKKAIVYIVDNTMTSPALFNPKEVKASLVVNSLTKYICGHGDALGGSITETGNFDWTRYTNILENYKKQPESLWGITQIRKKGLRDFGGALSPDNAHRISIGSETLGLRMERISSNAKELASFLSNHSSIQKVNYPGLESHPQHSRAKELFNDFSGLLSFELSNKIDVFEFLDQLKIIISSSNLGDNRTLAIPVAHTIFYEIGPEKRKRMGIADSLIRLSVGIENVNDLKNDIENALNVLG